MQPGDCLQHCGGLIREGKFIRFDQSKKFGGNLVVRAVVKLAKVGQRFLQYPQIGQLLQRRNGRTTKLRSCASSKKRQQPSE